MLLLAAMSHLIPARAQQPDRGPPSVNPALGHVGLTLIALVYLLIIAWQT